MPSTLAELRDRVELALSDTVNAIYTTDVIDECLRQALAEYSEVLPLELEATLIMPAAGREVDLSAQTGLLVVARVWWPYDSLATAETWPPNQVRGFHVYWDDANPILFLSQLDGDQPQAGDELRVWYTARQTIQDLDSAAATTVRPDHESLIVAGASGLAALARAQDLIETAGTDLYQVGLLASWAAKVLRDFRAALVRLRGSEARRGGEFGEGWGLDKWDSAR